MKIFMYIILFIYAILYFLLSVGIKHEHSQVFFIHYSFREGERKNTPYNTQLLVHSTAISHLPTEEKNIEKHVKKPLFI